MEINKCTKPSLAVIGKEGSTHEGGDFIQKLWLDANSHFNEIAPLACLNEEGKLSGIWGLMSDLSHQLKPWGDNFTTGYYLAGIEVPLEATTPTGWTKWTVPSYEYIYVKTETIHTFWNVLDYLKANKLELAGAPNDYTCPTTGQSYIYFPIKRL